MGTDQLEGDRGEAGPRPLPEDEAWGGRCGCLAAGAIGLPVLLLGLLTILMGDCEPHATCHRHDQLWMLLVAAVGLALAVAIRIAVGRMAVSMGAWGASLTFWIAAVVVAALSAWVAYIPGIF